jgi:hypothetical protein
VGFTSFLARRTLLGIVVMWVVTTATFLLFLVAPQNPARLIAGKGATAAEIAEITRRLGLDQPAPVQYWRYLDRLLHFDLGTRPAPPIATAPRSAPSSGRTYRPPCRCSQAGWCSGSSPGSPRASSAPPGHERASGGPGPWLAPLG